MASETCVLWTGGGGPRIDDAVGCLLNGGIDFELTCAPGATLPFWSFSVSVRPGAKLSVKQCNVTEYVYFQGDGSLVLEEVTVTGSLILLGLPSVVLDRVVVEAVLGNSLLMSSVSVEATSLTVRGVAHEPSTKCLIVLSSNFTVDDLSVYDCAALDHNVEVTASEFIVRHKFEIWNCTSGHSNLVYTDTNVAIGQWVVRELEAKKLAVAIAGGTGNMTVDTATFSGNSGPPAYVLTLGGNRMFASFNSLTMESNVVFDTALHFLAAFVTIDKLVSRCNVRHPVSPFPSLSLEVHCEPSPAHTLSVNSWELDTTGANPSTHVTNCPELYDIGVVYTDSPFNFADPFVQPILPSRGVCPHTCNALYPSGYGVLRNGGKELLSHPLDGSSSSFSSHKFPLSLAHIPPRLSDGTTVHQSEIVGMRQGEKLDFDCCPGDKACEFFVSVYGCLGCAGLSSRGLWPSLLDSDDWERGPCAPSFQFLLQGDQQHPMITFRAEVQPGDRLSLPVVNGDSFAVAVFARQLSDSATSDWCPRKISFGPHMPS
eukprot:gene3022-4750_t